MKARCASLQADVGGTEEQWAELADVTSIDGLPVVAAALHSQLPAIAAAFKRIAVPCVGGDEERTLRADLARTGLARRHDLVDTAPVGAVELLARHGLRVESMGRPAAADPSRRPRQPARSLRRSSPHATSRSLPPGWPTPRRASSACSTCWR